MFQFTVKNLILCFIVSFVELANRDLVLKVTLSLETRNY